MAKWCQFRLFSALISQNVATYIDAQSNHPVLWWFSVGCLPGLASWSHFKTTWTPMYARQACEWGLSKSRPLNLWQWYKHELLVYYCICRMAMISETWNCVCIRPLWQIWSHMSLQDVCMKSHEIQWKNHKIHNTQLQA